MSAQLENLLKQVNAAAREVVCAIQGIDTRIASLNAQRQMIGDAPVSRAEFLDYIGKTIDEKAGQFGSIKAREIAKISKSFFSIERSTPSINLLVSTYGTPVAITEEACYWYMKPVMMARMAEIADGLDFPDDAMPIEKRRAMIAEIDAEITKLRAERNELASQLQKAGLVS